MCPDRSDSHRTHPLFSNENSTNWCLNNRSTFGKFYNFGNITECQTGHRVGTTIINGHPSRCRIMQSRTREAYIGHITHAFVRFTRRDKIRSRTEFHLPGLVQVKQCRSKGIDITVAGTKHTVIEQQPALTGFDGNGAGANLQALPCTLLQKARVT